MIRMQGVVKTYPGRGGQAPQRVLKGVDLRVRPGEYVAFVGASGSGKSTLMHILGCLDTPTGGRYLLDGEDVSRLDAKALCRVRREKIGFVFQGYQLLSKLTAADNVAFPLMLRGVPEAERARRAAEALARVGLAGRGQSRPCELSGGQQQRVAVARAATKGSCVMSTTVCPLRCSWSNRSRSSLRLSTSSAPVGSSHRSSRGE